MGPIGSGAAGGVETHLLGLAPILVARGYEVGVVAPAGSVIPGAGVMAFLVPGKPSASATTSRRRSPVEVRSDGVLENMWEQALRLQNRFDVVVGIDHDWLAFYLTPFFSKPVAHWITICSAIEEVDRMIKRRWREQKVSLAFYTAAQAATYPFLPPEAIHLLYGGVDTGVFQYNAQPEDRLCWAGRISPEKGLEDAIAAAQALGMPLDVCGRLHDKFDWPAGTVYHGFLGPAELQRRFAGARATLVTPHWIEAFGNVAIESMACGTPVVAYDRGGPAEIVEHGKSGILVPQGDVAGLVGGVRAAIALDRRVVQARAAEFSFARMADRFENWIGGRHAIIG